MLFFGAVDAVLVKSVVFVLLEYTFVKVAGEFLPILLFLPFLFPSLLPSFLPSSFVLCSLSQLNIIVHCCEPATSLDSKSSYCVEHGGTYNPVLEDAYSFLL